MSVHWFWDCGFPCMLIVVLCFRLMCFSFAFVGLVGCLGSVVGCYYWLVVFC